MSGATLEGTAPYDENVWSGSWYRLRTHLGMLDEGSDVYNAAMMGAGPYRDRGQRRTGNGRALGDGGRGVSCL